MDIKQTAAHLQRLGQPFDVIIIKNGQERPLYTNLEPTDVVTLLNEVNETHQPDALVIQERRRNGSTNVKQDKYPVSIGAMGALGGFDGGYMPVHVPAPPARPLPTNSLPGDFKDYMIGDLKEKNGKLEKRLEKLEDENEQLKKQNFELEKENKYKDREFELSRKADEYEKSSGLAGIVDKVASNPALAAIAATAIGRLMGMDVPPMGGFDGSQASEQLPAGDSTQEKVAGYIRGWLVKVDETTASKFFELSNLIAQNTGLLDDILPLLKQQNNE